MARPVVAIVGRPNVGKSTLFNRLIGEQRAVMHDVPGTTRDRLYGTAEWRGREFTVIDTGGIEPEPGLTRAVPDNGALGRWGTLPTVEILDQAREAMDEADVILFVVDAASGPVAADVDVADLLRRSRKPVLLAANKADGLRQGRNAVEFFELGLGEAIPISSLHGTGTGDLLDEIVDRLPPSEDADDDEADLSIAIVGRPNVGKSSLLNALAGSKKLAKVSGKPGRTQLLNCFVTPDGATVLDLPGYGYASTASAKTRSTWRDRLEQYLLQREGLILTLLLVDGVIGPTKLDLEMLGWLRGYDIPFVVVATKYDKVKASKRHRRQRDLAAACAVAPVDVMWVSAEKNVGIDDLRTMIRNVLAPL